MRIYIRLLLPLVFAGAAAAQTPLCTSFTTLGELEAQGATGCQLGRFRLYNFSYSDTTNVGTVTDPASSSGSAPEVTSDHVLVTFDETVPLKPTMILRPDSATAGAWTATGAGSNNSTSNTQSATSLHNIQLNYAVTSLNALSAQIVGAGVGIQGSGTWNYGSSIPTGNAGQFWSLAVADGTITPTAGTAIHPNANFFAPNFGPNYSYPSNLASVTPFEISSIPVQSLAAPSTGVSIEKDFWVTSGKGSGSTASLTQIDEVLVTSLTPPGPPYVNSITCTATSACTTNWNVTEGNLLMALYYDLNSDSGGGISDAQSNTYTNLSYVGNYDASLALYGTTLSSGGAPLTVTSSGQHTRMVLLEFSGVSPTLHGNASLHGDSSYGNCPAANPLSVTASENDLLISALVESVTNGSTAFTSGTLAEGVGSGTGAFQFVYQTAPSAGTYTQQFTFSPGFNAGNQSCVMIALGVKPAIASVSPSAGMVGDPITITGTNFGSSQGTSAITFGGTAATVSSWTANSIVALVPVGATSGNIVVNVGGVASDGSPFTVVLPPVISSVSPQSGPIGASVTIAGTNFGTTQGTVTFAGTAAAITSWSATSIVAQVPTGATTGNVVVTAGGLTSNGSPFTVTTPTPAITSLSPTSGAPGAAVTITGTNFGTLQGSSTVTFNGSVAAVSVWSATSIIVYVPAGVGNGNVVVTVGGVASNGSPFTVTATPAISSVSPESGAAGTVVTIVGTGFGDVAGSGRVWLGSTYGTVSSWSDTQIVAAVATGATSGIARVQQGGVWSNSHAFTVANAAISDVTPNSGVAGTQVTITGTGFGASQGNGQVWLGTATAVVSTWSDTQIVALVAAGARSGSARVLQNGVLTNAIAFDVPDFHITNVTPSSGAAGTSVTIAGSGFGSGQGTGSVLLGSINGQILSWTDTQVVATVSLGSVTGVARIQQNGAWSNAVAFTVPVAPGDTVTLSPSVLNLVVGDTRTIQATNQAGQMVTGLTWASSDSTMVSLSTADPPVLTALVPGHVTITAGAASVDVTVYADALPTGTVIWSNPGNGSGVTKIVPAVPSSTGVADVFAFQADGTVQAITADGTTAWTATIACSNGAPSSYPIIPDFQGGLIAMQCAEPHSIVKFDGITGQPYPAYSPTAPWQPTTIPGVHGWHRLHRPRELPGEPSAFEDSGHRSGDWGREIQRSPDAVRLRPVFDDGV